MKKTAVVLLAAAMLSFFHGEHHIDTTVEHVQSCVGIRLSEQSQRLHSF